MNFSNFLNQKEFLDKNLTRLSTVPYTLNLVSSILMCEKATAYLPLTLNNGGDDFAVKPCKGHKIEMFINFVYNSIFSHLRVKGHQALHDS